MHVRIFICMYVRMYACTYVWTYVCVCWTYVCEYVADLKAQPVHDRNDQRSVAGSAFCRFVQAKGRAQVQELLASQEPLLTHDEWCVFVYVCVYGREKTREKEREKKLARRFSLTINGV